MTYPGPVPIPPPAPPTPPAFPELRDSDDVQGNILAGFRKDRQSFLFVQLADQTSGRTWLSELAPRLASTRQVATFNAAFSRARRAGGGDPEDLDAVWVNLGLTAQAVQMLATSALLSPEPGDDPYLSGAHNRAAMTGDTGPSAADNWLFGRSEQRIHAVLIIAADRASDLQSELARQRESLARHGATLVFEQAGATLTGARRGHEHFGFKDGISQPGVVGFDEEDEAAPGQVKARPGMDLVAAGEFVLGYPDQAGAVSTLEWLHNGSFLVIRRLVQDVPGWWAQMIEQARADQEQGGLKPDQLAAKAVGRWRSGTPLDEAPEADRRSGRDSSQDNNFDYANDEDGTRTPRFAHIRKVYPRNSPTPGEAEAGRHRIIRRGIPFGLQFDPAEGRGRGVDAPRGLIFAAYMADIARGFEFLQRRWANAVDFPEEADGADPVIGPSSVATIHREAGPLRQLSFGQFVRTAGALYAFSPSISTIGRLSRGEL
jgi:Dyp-type peroxidase family